MKISEAALRAFQIAYERECGSLLDLEAAKVAFRVIPDLPPSYNPHLCWDCGRPLAACPGHY